MSVFLVGVGLGGSFGAGVCAGVFILRSPLMISHCSVEVAVLVVARVKGGVASGECGVCVRSVSEVVSNMDSCQFAQSGAGASEML